jgi:hypothetical protein
MLGHLPEPVNVSMLRTVRAWLVAVLVAYAVAAVATTQSVMANLVEMGVPIDLGDRLRTTGQDLLGMTSSYAPMIAVGFAIAFGVAALVLRKRPDWRWFGYPLAGGLAILVIHLALEAMLSITPIAAARTMLGLSIQIACGVLGGWVYGRMRPAAPRA